MKITTNYLVSLAACQEGIDAFLSIFPNGEVELNSDNISRALHGDLDVCWLIERINDPKALAELSEYDSYLVREIVAGNRNTPAEALVKLSKACAYSVRREVAINQNTPAEILVKLSQDEHDWVRARVASNQNTPAETLAELSKDGDYWVRNAVTKNPTYKGAQTA